jgi:predicted DNA-binding transcriptional regulator AlpA
MLRAAQVAERLGIGLSSWYRWIQAGLVEGGVKIGAKTVVWVSLYIEQLMQNIIEGRFSTDGLYAKERPFKQSA